MSRVIRIDDAVYRALQLVAEDPLRDKPDTVIRRLVNEHVDQHELLPCGCPFALVRDEGRHQGCEVPAPSPESGRI